MLSNCGAREDSWESLRQQGDQTNQSEMKSSLNNHWKDWCWSWSSNTLATWCEEPTQWKRLWCWEGLRAGGEEDDRGWDGRMASLTRWMWVWVNSGSWWWTGRPGVLRFMGLQRVGHDWATELNWTIIPKVLMQMICVWECKCPESRKETSYYSLTYCICQSHGRTRIPSSLPEEETLIERLLAGRWAGLRKQTWMAKHQKWWKASKTLNQSRYQQEIDD